MRKYLILLLLLLPLFACSKKQEDKVVVATIDGDKITATEFNNELDKIPMNMKMLVASQSGKRNFLDRLIVQRLLLREAKKEDIEKGKEFQDKLSEFKDQLIMQTLLAKKVAMQSKFPDEELQKYYDAHKEEFKKEKEIQTRQIVVKTEQEAKELRAKIAKGEDFTDLAKKYSLDPSARVNGGDIGYHPKGTLIPEYEEVAFKLAKIGEVSQPVKTQLGYHLIKLEGIKPPAYMPFAEVKDFIRQKLVQEKQTEMVQKYIDDLKKNSKIVVNDAFFKEEAKQPAAPAGQGAKEEPAAKTAPAGQDQGVSPGQATGAAK